MNQFKSPAALDLPQLPLHASVPRLVLACAVSGLAAAAWISAGARADAARSEESGAAMPANVVRVTLPPVVVIGHRDSVEDATTTTVAGMAPPTSQASGLDPAVPAANRVNLRQ